MGRASIEGPLGRFADVRRRVEVGLADLQVNDRSTGCLEGPGSGGGLEGRLGPDPIHSCCEPHRVTSVARSAGAFLGWRPLASLGGPSDGLKAVRIPGIRPSMAAGHTQIKFSFLAEP